MTTLFFTKRLQLLTQYIERHLYKDLNVIVQVSCQNLGYDLACLPASGASGHLCVLVQRFESQSLYHVVDMQMLVKVPASVWPCGKRGCSIGFDAGLEFVQARALAWHVHLGVIAGGANNSPADGGSRPRPTPL